jgi:hypothetical protein
MWTITSAQYEAMKKRIAELEGDTADLVEHHGEHHKSEEERIARIAELEASLKGLRVLILAEVGTEEETDEMLNMIDEALERKL